MKNKICLLLALLTATQGMAAAVPVKIQKQGVKTLAECVAAGGTAANCPIDTSQIYDGANAQMLNASIANGQLGGGGGGSKNYLTSYTPSTNPTVANTGNGDAELNATTGWSLAHSALTSLVPSSVATAGTPFSSSTGGTAASGNLSLGIESSVPLQKKYSFKLASTAASTPGDMMISDAYYIDASDKTLPETITLSTSVSAGASTLNFSGSSANSFAIYVYDVTSAQWIQPAGVYGMVSSGAFNVKNVTFQPVSSSSTRYQIAFVNVNASSGAYTMLFDAIGVGPQAALSAPALGDFKTYPLTIGGSTTAPTPGTLVQNKAYYRQVGDSVEIHYEFAQSSAGSAGSGTYLFPLPPGLVADTSKINTAPTAINGSQTLGSAVTFDGTSFNTDLVELFNSTNLAISGPAGALVSSTSNALGNTVQRYSFEAVVPIQGWSSNTVSSADTDNRLIVAKGTLSAASVSFANAPSVASLVFGTTLQDTAGAYNGSTTYTIPSSQNYKIFAQLAFASNTTGVRRIVILKNGTAIGSYQAPAAASGETFVQSLVQDKFTAGDLITFQYIQSSGAALSVLRDYTGTNDGSYFTIEKISGSAVVQATESVTVDYNTSTDAATTDQKITFTNKVIDDHNAYSAGVFTAPVSGTYMATASVLFAGTFSLNTLTQLNFIKNAAGSSSQPAQQLYYAGGAITNQGANISTLVKMIAGDTLQLNAGSAASGATLSGTGASRNFINIVRVGN